MENQKSSHMSKEAKKTKKTSKIDPCPICSKELHLNEKYTQRIGLLGNFDEVIGWLCPHCKSEFDEDNRIVKFLGENSIRGEA